MKNGLKKLLSGICVLAIISSNISAVLAENDNVGVEESPIQVEQEDSSLNELHDEFEMGTVEDIEQIPEGESNNEISLMSASVGISTIQGKVVDENNNGVSNITVMVYDATESEVLGCYITDENGMWQCNNAVEGHNYIVRYYHPRYSIKDNTVKCTATLDDLTIDIVTVQTVVPLDTSTPTSDFTYSVYNGIYCSITGYTGNDQVIVIPESIDGYTVQSIASNAFKNNTGIETVVISDSVEALNSYAFYGCSNLKYVGFGNKVTTIGDGVFRYCTNLEKISFSNGITVIDCYAFADCTNLDDIDFSVNLNSIGENAFQNCLFEEIDLPDSVTKLCANAFLNCVNLSKFGYPANWTQCYYRIDNEMYDGYGYNKTPFVGCTALKEIVVDEGVTVIPKYAFRYCSSLEMVIFPKSLTKIERYAFDECTALKSVELYDNMTIIDDYVFRSCTGLTKLSLPKTNIEIYKNAFEGCRSLTEITIPEGVTYLSECVFKNCTRLVKVSLPNTLTTIYSFAFENCSFTEIDIPDSVTKIAAEAFLNCTNLSKVGYPANWTQCYYRIDNEMYDGYGYNKTPFVGCTALKKIVVDEGVTVIPKYAFRYCPSLETVELPESLNRIERYVFDGCPNLKTVTLKEKLTVIENCAFRSCVKLAVLSLPESLAEIQGWAFENCSSLKEMTIPEGVTILNEGVFKNCTGLTDVNLPNTLTTIYPYVFENCLFEKIDIPDSVTIILSEAFLNCKNLSKVGYPANWTTCSWRMNNEYSDGYGGNKTPFAGCTSLKEITIDEGVTEIPKYAFRYLTSLETVILPESLRSIGGYAFDGCTALEKIWIDKNVSSVGQYAFGNCSNLTIHGVSKTYAEEYAKNGGFPFSTERLVYEKSGISGKITNESGKGVVGAIIGFYDVDENKWSEPCYTDTNGEWCGNLIIGHTYIIRYHHNRYTINDSLHTVTVGNEAKILPDAVAYEEVPADKFSEINDFTYVALNGTYCSITGYTGDDSIVVIPSEIDGYKVQEIAENAFRDKDGIKKVVIPDNVEIICPSAFYGCRNLEFVGFGNAVATIGDSAFRGCIGLEKMSFSNCITMLENFAFADCSKLNEIDFSVNLKSIGSNAFESCAFTEIDIPDSVTSIAAEAFLNCASLSKIGYPSGWTQCYWRPDNEYSDGYGGNKTPFVGCTSLKEIVVDEGVTSIPKYAFRYMTSLEKIVLPESVTKIERYAFDGCSNLKTLALSDKLKIIEDWALRECTGLTEIVLPESLEGIYSYAFEGCTALKEITVPEGVTVLNDGVFKNCTGLVEVNLPNTLTTIYPYVFENCLFEKIDIPDSVTIILSEAFLNCKNLSKVGYPANWTTCSWRMNNEYSDGYGGNKTPFVGCTSLKEITIDEGVTEIPKYAFRYLTSLKTVVLPESLEKIDDYAFEGCSGLIGVVVHKTVSSIDNSAFNNCSNELVFYCNSDSYAEQYAIEKNIKYADIVNMRSNVAYNEKLYYTVKEYKRGYAAYNTKMGIVYNDSEADKVEATVSYIENGEEKTSTFDMLAVNSAVFKENFEIKEGMSEITSIVLHITSGEETRQEVFRNSYWYAMPLKMEGILQVSFGDRVSIFSGMTLKLFDEKGKAVDKNIIDGIKDIYFHGLAQGNYTLKMYGGDLEYAVINDISVSSGHLSNIDLSQLETPANLNIMFTSGGKPVNDKSLRASFTDKTEGKNRLLKPGISVCNLASGDTVGYSLLLDNNTSKIYRMDSTENQVVLQDGTNNIQLEVSKFADTPVTGIVVDTDTNVPVGNVRVSAVQKLNGIHSVSAISYTRANGSFLLNMKDSETTITVSKSGYKTRTFTCSVADMENGLSIPISRAGAKVDFDLSFMQSVKEANADAEVKYNLRPDKITLYNNTRNNTVNLDLSCWPYAYVETNQILAGDSITATVSKTGYGDVSIDTVADSSGGIKISGIIYQKGEISCSITKKDSSGKNQIVIFDSNGSKCFYKKNIGTSFNLSNVDAGYYTVVLADECVGLLKYNLLSQLLDEPDILNNIVLNKIIVNNGIISECDCEIPVPAEKKNHLDSETSTITSGKDNAVVGDTVVINTNVNIIDFNEINDAVVYINIPQGVKIIEGTYMINNESAEFVNTNNIISVPMESNSQTIRFSGRILATAQTDNLNFSGHVEYNKDGKSISENIGSASVELNEVTLVIPTVTKNGKIIARGSAAKNADIEIYDNDILIAETTANQYGIYRTEAELFDKSDNSIHYLRAKNADSEALSQTEQIVYGNSAIEIIRFEIKHNYKSYIADTPNEEIPVFNISMVPSKPFDFVVSFNDNSSVAMVNAVVGLSNGNNELVPLNYNNEKKCFEGSVQLSESKIPVNFGISYVPLKFNVCSTENSENAFDNAVMSTIFYKNSDSGDKTMYVEEGIDLNNNRYNGLIYVEDNVSFVPNENYISMELDGKQMYFNPLYVGLKKDDCFYAATQCYIKNDDGTYALWERGVGTAIDTNIDSVSLTELGFGDVFETVFDSTSDSEVHDVKSIKKAVDKINSTTDAVNMARDTSDLSKLAENLIEYLKVIEANGEPELTSKVALYIAQLQKYVFFDNSLIAFDLVEKYIYNSDANNSFADSDVEILNKIFNKDKDEVSKYEEELIGAMKNKVQASYIEQFRELMLEIISDKELMNAIDELEKENQSVSFSSDKFDGGISKIKKVSSAKTSVDPSGYAYETLPSNRLSDVTVTIFFENDFGQMEWWDAEEYYQTNPLITDDEGKYAWDVPEGLWQVKFEKEEYETAFSEKMTVPPDRTDINIPMISNRSANVQSISSDDNQIKIRFDKYLLSDTVLQDTISATLNGKEIEVIPVLENIFESEYGRIVDEIYIAPKFGELESGEYIISLNDSIKTYAGVALEVDNQAINVDVKSEKAITFNSNAKTTTINAENEYDNVTVCFATYKNDRLVTLQFTKKNLVIGSNVIMPKNMEAFSLDNIDTVKVFVFESLSNIKPLFDACVVRMAE